MIAKSEPGAPVTVPGTTVDEMTVARCPEGGFTVYSRTEEHVAFVRNSHLIPIAGFADLKAALAFIERKMDRSEEAPRG